MPKIQRTTREKRFAKRSPAQSGRIHSDPRYNSTRWRKERKHFLIANPLCVDCLTEGRSVSADTVDHKRRVKDGADFWDQTNWQPLCTRHHNKKSGQESRRGNGGRKNIER